MVEKFTDIRYYNSTHVQAERAAALVPRPGPGAGRRDLPGPAAVGTVLYCTVDGTVLYCDTLCNAAGGAAAGELRGPRHPGPGGQPRRGLLRPQQSPGYVSIFLFVPP